MVGSSRDQVELFHQLEQQSALSGLSGRCAICKGSKLLCGKSSCPLMLRYHSRMKTRPLLDKEEIDGSSPPAVFIGRFGYPKVLVGPMVPPQYGDTEILDTPEQWVGRSLDEIVDFRYSLVRGTYQTDIHNVESAGRLVDLTREMAMASKPADIEVQFTKKPRGGVSFQEESSPFGPSARSGRLPLRPSRLTSASTRPIPIPTWMPRQQCWSCTDREHSYRAYRRPSASAPSE